MYEASDIPLGDHLCEKSQTTEWINVSQPQHQRRRLLNHCKLVEMQEKNCDSTDIFEDNLIDTHYPQRHLARTRMVVGALTSKLLPYLFSWVSILPCMICKLMIMLDVGHT